MSACLAIEDVAFGCQSIYEVQPQITVCYGVLLILVRCLDSAVCSVNIIKPVRWMTTIDSIIVI